ncbi:MAG: hypothetical protein KBT10_01985 [Bacteroidales bacterium]|nr:hypothetical protein [Candidatus Sodaliphilus aphodohippi]
MIAYEVIDLREQRVEDVRVSGNESRLVSVSSREVLRSDIVNADRHKALKVPLFNNAKSDEVKKTSTPAPMLWTGVLVYGLLIGT